jgi:GNAT superfamily N-acetyltransferase
VSVSGLKEFPFVLRGIRAGDEAPVLELLRTTLGEKATTRKTADYWTWKHVGNPFGASYTVCAEDPQSHELVGLRTMMRWVYLDSAGAEHRAARAVDTATHPSYQRRGIFSALTRYAVAELRAAGVAFIFNTPNQNSLPGYLKMGWRVVERWPVLVRPVRPLRTAGRLLGGRSANAAPPGLNTAGLVEWMHFRGRYGDQVDGVVAAHERQRERVGYRTLRSPDYLDWRFGSHPDVRYGVHAVADSHGSLEGFLIARPALGMRGLTAMTITEVFVRDASTAALIRLFRSAFRCVDCDYWSAHFAIGTHERRALARVGFVQAPARGYTWTTLPLNPTADDPASASAWDLTLSEMEIF